MKRRIMLHALEGFLVLMVLSGGQCLADKTLELGAGIASPVGNLQDNWNTAYGFNGAFLVEVTPFFWGGVSGGYGALGFDEDAFGVALPADDASTVTGGDASILSVCAEVRAQTGAMEKAVFFGGLGTGLYRVSISDITYRSGGELHVLESDAKNRWGGFVNAGFGIPVSSAVRLGARAQYNFYWVNEGGGESDLVETDKSSSYLTVQAMVMFSFGS